MMGGASLACQVFKDRAKTASRRRPHGGLGLAGVGEKGVSDRWQDMSDAKRSPDGAHGVELAPAKALFPPGGQIRI